MRLLLFSFLFAAAASGQNDFYLHAGDRVVFYGDSITDQRLYTTFVETYVVTRFPNMPVSFVHSGWGGDRVTGGGGGTVDVRLDRDVFPYHPTVVTIMLGMNDGGYRAFDSALFATYSEGYQHIIGRIHDDAPGVRITVIQPSPYDDVTRAPGFEGGYNGTLLRYSALLKELAAKNHLALADLNTPVIADLERAKQVDPALAQKLIPDRVHPGAAGHMLMAEALLKAWNAPALVTEVELDGAAGKLIAAQNTTVTNTGKIAGITWDQLDRALPFPIDWKDREKLVPLAMHASDFLEVLNGENLRVTGLAPGNYLLRIDGETAVTLSGADLQHGLNLATLPTTPMMKQALAVHALTLQRANIHNFRWRNIQVPLADMELPDKAPAIASLDKLDNELMERQRAAAKPKPHHFEVVRVAEQ